MNLVIGATGTTGGEICRLLRGEYRAVRALVRETSDKAKVNHLKKEGIELVTGDLRDKNSIEKALQGVNAIVVTASSMPVAYVPGENDPDKVDRFAMIDLINRAEKAGVKRFVYTSFSGNIDLDFPLRNAKRAVEDRLKQSKMVYTILRPSFFMEAWLSPLAGFDPEKGEIRIYGDGSQPVSYISYQDVAQFAFQSLSNPEARNVVFELGGPEPMTQLHVVQLFEKAHHRKLHLNYLPEDELIRQYELAKDPMEKSFAGLSLSIAKGDYIEMKEIMRHFRIKLKSVEEFAQQSMHLTHT